MLDIRGNSQYERLSNFDFKDIWNFITLSIIIQDPISKTKISFTINGFNIINSPKMKVIIPIINWILIVLNSLNSEK